MLNGSVVAALHKPGHAVTVCYESGHGETDEF